MINKVVLVGNLGADPDTRTTTGGKMVTEMRIATSYGTGDEKKTEWHRVITWDKTADACSKFLKKGRQVYVEGRLTTRSYDDKEGNKKYVTEIIAQEVKFLGEHTKDVAADLPF
jgi:single-strand DNA-binding protein